MVMVRARAETVWVQATRTDGRVALWERHPHHPGGEAFILGRQSVEVALTDAVVRALERGQLVLSQPRESAAVQHPRFFSCWRLPGEGSRDMPVRVDAIASMPHYLDHLAPVLHALGPWGGRLFVPETLTVHTARLGFEPDPDPATTTHGRHAVTLVAGYTDAKRVARGRPVVLMEHGAGQTYQGARSSAYSAGRGMEDNVLLFLAPGEASAARWRAARPDVPAVAVGCPKLDARHVAGPKPAAEPPVVALTWHWDAGAMVPEAGWALPHYVHALPALAAAFPVIGHAHPRCIEQVRHWYRAAGIELVRDLDAVFDRADVLVADNTSALYEFASLGRPVVTLNAPWYRRDVQHGLRFWDAIPGVACDDPQDLIPAVARAIEDEHDARQRRDAAVAAVYGPCDGNAAERAATATIEAVSARWAA